MRFQYASDLHLEFNENYHWFLKDQLKPSAPYLILAGDIDIIHNGEITRPDLFQYFSDNWNEVFIIPGNHEFYRGGDVSKSYNIDLKIHPNVRYLNHQKVHIEGVDFLFTTLWSMTRSSLIKNLIADFRSCKFGADAFKYKNHDRLHEKAINWLKNQLKEEKKHPRVVVSHFVPCSQADGYPESNDPYLGPIIKRYFVADLEYYIKDWDIDYWLYGHSHWNKNTDAFGVKFRSNQFGYSFKFEHTDFKIDAVIEINPDGI